MDIFKTSNGKVLTCKPPDMHQFDEFSLSFWMKQLVFSANFNIIEISKTILIFTIATSLTAGNLAFSNTD